VEQRESILLVFQQPLKRLFFLLCLHTEIKVIKLKDKKNKSALKLTF